MRSNRTRKERFLREYGEVMSCAEVASVLKYPSVEAVKKAHSRGSLPVALKRFPNRKELFAATLDVVAVLDDSFGADKDRQTGTREDAMT